MGSGSDSHILTSFDKNKCLKESCAAPYTGMKTHSNPSFLDLRCNFTQKSPVSNFFIGSISDFMPTMIPPDRPCGGKQNQWKSFRAAKLCKNGTEKLDLPVSSKAIKSK
jgi:hypothetical protein